MGRRTTVALVERALAGNRGKFNGVIADLDQCIEAAAATVDQVVALVPKSSMCVAPLAADYELMERFLAAYKYTQIDPLHTNRSTEGASANFVVDKLDPNRYKVLAIQADPSGILSALLNRQVAGSVALDKPISQRVNYADRS